MVMQVEETAKAIAETAFSLFDSTKVHATLQMWGPGMANSPTDRGVNPSR